MFFVEFFFNLFRYCRMQKNPLIRRLRYFLIGAPIFRLHLFFFKRSPYGHKVDQVRRQHAIKPIQRLNRFDAVKPLIPDRLSNHMAVAFSTYILSFFLPGRDRDSSMLSFSHHSMTNRLMNSEPVSGCAPNQGNGSCF